MCVCVCVSVWHVATLVLATFAAAAAANEHETSSCAWLAKAGKESVKYEMSKRVSRARGQAGRIGGNCV